DKQRREAIEAKNQLESLVFSVGKHFDENKDKIPESDRSELEAALKDGREALENNKDMKEAEVFKSAFERLQKVSHKMAEALYRAASDGAAAGSGDGTGSESAPPAGTEGTGGKDDVIDAEYTEGPK
ncbi:MAG: Hsp70 family protein, partial [Polyangia bacterium]